MTLILEVPPDIERGLREMAERQGQTPDELAIQALGRMVAESAHLLSHDTDTQQVSEGAEEDSTPFGAGMTLAARERLAALGVNSHEDLMTRNWRAIELLRQWSREDAENPDPDPVPEIPPLSLREVDVD